MALFNPSEPKSAFERLAANPTGMNWRGEWNATTQYFLNDVVLSPANINSYVLIGQTTLLGGDDPTLNPDWNEISPATTGVQQVDVNPLGLSNTGTATIPILNNTGVLTLALATPTSGLLNSGTAQNPVLANDGVLQLTQGTGITLTGTKANYTISSAGSAIPIVSYFPPLTPTFTGGQQPLQISDKVRIPIRVNQFPNTVFGQSWLPQNIGNFSAGVWVLDMQGVCFSTQNVAITSPPIYIQIGIENDYNDVYIIPPDQGGQLDSLGAAGVPDAFVFSGAKFWFNSPIVENALNQNPNPDAPYPKFITFTNFTTAPLFFTSYPSSVVCTYYPNGIQ